MKKRIYYLQNTDRILEEVNQILKGASLNEAPISKKTTITKREQFVLDSWKALKNKTKVFETIPLIFAISKSNNISANDMITLLNKNYDWDKDGKSWLINVLTKIKDDSIAYKTFVKIVVESAVNKNAPSLKELNSNKIITGFIHGSITKFYATLKKYSAHNADSKTFTADVVLLWGPGTWVDVINKDLLKNVTPTSESLVVLGDKKTVMACVSLKALEGRVGKVTSLFQSKFGIKESSEEQNIEEGIFSGLTDMFSDAIEKAKNSKVFKTAKEAFVKFTDWAKKTFETLKTVFSPTTKEVLEAKSENEEIIDEAETLLKEFDKEIQEHFNRTGKTLTEVSEDEPIQISSCFKKQLLSWYSKFESNTKKYNQVFNEFKNKTSKYSNTNYFRLSFTSLPEKTKEYTEELNRIKQMINLVKSSTEKKNVNKKISCALLYTGTKPLTFTRKELKTVLMSSANYVSVSLLNSMIDQYLAKSKSLNTKQSIESLIKFSTELNAEAIFGAATEIPLIKYTGKEIIKFGSRKNYEESQSKKMVEYFMSVKTLPIIGLKIYPPKSKSGGLSTYYSILMYSLSDYTGSTGTKPLDKDFKYNVIAFKCNSGSDFAFAVESDTTLTGDKVIKALLSNEVPTE